MGLDYGERRIGVAMSDPLGVIAQPLETIERNAKRPDAWLERIAELVAEYEVEQVVVGLPLHMDGRAGPEAERARDFGKSVEARTGKPVEWLDERWTSIEAERALASTGTSRKKQRGRVDPTAAAILLRTWLERRQV